MSSKLKLSVASLVASFGLLGCDSPQEKAQEKAQEVEDMLPEGQTFEYVGESILKQLGDKKGRFRHTYNAENGETRVCDYDQAWRRAAVDCYWLDEAPAIAPLEVE